MKNADIPAMPVQATEGVCQAIASSSSELEGYINCLGGLTKREMMAMHMMQGILASGNADEFVVGDEVGFAGFAVNCADSLLAELERKCQKP